MICVKNIGIYISLAIIFILGVFFIVFGNNYNKREKEFKINAGVVTAKIYQNSIINNKQVLYIRYFINGEEYNGVVSSYRRQKYGNSIKIYYNKSKPTEYIIDKENYIGHLFIILGISLIIISITFVIRMHLDE